MISTKEKELQELKSIVKHFQVARSLRKNYEVPKYIKIEKDKIKMTDGTFLVELPNNFGFKEQYIEIDSFLKNGTTDHRYESIYPNFEVVKIKFENPYKFKLDIKEFLKKIKINYKRVESGIDMVFRIVGGYLYVYLRFAEYFFRHSYKYEYKKLGVIKINDLTNTNARLMLDPVKVVNLFKIFEKAGARWVDVEFKSFHIREWSNRESYREWIRNYPIKLTSENIYSLIMQRG
jgi:hypothetical protein